MTTARFFCRSMLPCPNWLDPQRPRFQGDCLQPTSSKRAQSNRVRRMLRIPFLPACPIHERVEGIFAIPKGCRRNGIVRLSKTGRQISSLLGL